MMWRLFTALVFTTVLAGVVGLLVLILAFPAIQASVDANGNPLFPRSGAPCPSYVAGCQK